ncbi:GLPGLI family protein [Sphingobacterium oryzagri]|uniref:GLPGLI family protein n=1 Tax=Sphingobacterium oryzagri TaxID=3025669 RepID=A0ABY7WJE1_9SPHI|nr:GLPGLI family protein [Sphingobacterium sp. KACC 22765]WDF69712.1 GLPGLI family protein [Sphingobacterium sp. KACC 22765]
MVSKLVYIVILLVFTCQYCVAQSNEVESGGAVHFVRRTNTHAIMDSIYGTAKDPKQKRFLEDFKATYPKFSEKEFKLFFNQDNSLYVPLNNNLSKNYLSEYADDNIIYSDLLNGTVTSKKKIQGTEFLTVDTMKDIRWRITNELREIAGYTCRRANALLDGEIYLVAYYTDQLLPKVGPERINGLPGLILGLAAPREHVSWFARTVEIGDFSSSISIPTQGIKMDESEIVKDVQANPIFIDDESMLNWVIKRILF